MSDAPGTRHDDPFPPSHPADGTYHADPMLPPRRRSTPPWLWAVFVVMVAGIVAMQSNSRKAANTPPATPPDPATSLSPFVKMIGKMAIGIDAAAQSGNAATFDGYRRQILDELDKAAVTPLDQLRAVPPAAWAKGKDEALARLDIVAAKNSGSPQVDPGFEQDVSDLRTILTSGSAALDAASRDRLLVRHGWFAESALALDAPPNDPSRTALLAGAAFSMAFLVGAGIVVIGALALGLVALVIILVGHANGRLVVCHRYDLAASSPTGPALLEAAILFLAGFVVVQLIASLLAGVTGRDFSSLLVWFLLLTALWPLARGVPWSRLKYALGWHKGRGVVRELFAGFAGYLAGLPVVALSFLVTMLLMRLTSSQPSHPVVEHMARQTPLDLIAMFALGTLWAPIVEETIFRGALFHHLRRGVTAVLAALLVGLVFAVIHPQGIALVPPLMTLGAVFAMIREWRGSLIGPVAAHAIHNGFLMTMLAVLLS